MRNRPAFSLLELLLVLSLCGTLLLLSSAAFRHARDVFATRAARDFLLTQIALTRTLAAAHAGAELRLDPVAGDVVIRSGAGVQAQASLQQRFRVQLSVGGQTAPVTLRYDAIGLGRMANRTLALSRGGARAQISISAYGRARPW